MKRMPNGPLDPRRHVYSMREAKRLAIEIGATVELNHRSELVFHDKTFGSVIVKANRREASDRLVSWLRKLYAAREQLHAAIPGLEAQG